MAARHQHGPIEYDSRAGRSNGAIRRTLWWGEPGPRQRQPRQSAPTNLVVVVTFDNAPAGVGGHCWCQATARLQPIRAWRRHVDERLCPVAALVDCAPA